MFVIAALVRNPWRWAWVWAFLAGVAFAQNLQPIPPLTSPVMDESNTLDAIQRKGIEDKLIAFEKQKGTQIAVLMVKTTQPEDIASYANRVGNAWKIGRKQVGDGVLIVVAKDDRKVRIEVAKSLEGAIPDLAAKNIIDEAITPNFKKGDFAGGLRAAIDQLTARISGEKLPEPKQAPSGGKHVIDSGFNWFDIAIFFFFAVPIAGAVARRMLGRSLGTLATGGVAGVLALLLTSSVIIAGIAAFIALIYTAFAGATSGLGSRRGGGWGGGPWISGGGGGGSWGGGSSSSDSWGGSGGGGDFGGGGASGDW